MSTPLRFDIAETPLIYSGHRDDLEFDQDRLIEYNHRHKAVLANYDIHLSGCTLSTLGDAVNPNSNLGALRNRQLRQSVVLSAALSAVAVALHGRGKLNSFPKDKQTSDQADALKRANDRTSAQVMAEVLQTTTETLPVGEEVLIESRITEGVRVKPGKEAGGNPTIAVGALFGKDEHRSLYGINTPRNVTLLSSGNDVIDGTTKSIKGLHSSLTAIFVTESNIKRHLPDIYVQRWMGGAMFDEFNPRETSLAEAAEIIAGSYGYRDVGRLASFFIDRARHYPAMDALNKIGVATPFDKDGDLMPAVVLGLEGLEFPDGRCLNSMIGEIGGSAEWAVGVLPLVWRGGQALGMLTSQSSLTKKDLTPEQLWKERFHYTEEEYMLIQDARFERKPYFTVNDILDDPFAGGIAAFGAITDNCYLTEMHGVASDAESGVIQVSTLAVTSLGVVQIWHMTFVCNTSLDHTRELMRSPKERLESLADVELDRAVGEMLNTSADRQRFRIFFNTEYYPAIIPVRERVVLLHKAVDTLIERGALSNKDREIIESTERVIPEWFMNSD